MSTSIYQLIMALTPADRVQCLDGLDQISERDLKKQFDDMLDDNYGMVKIGPYEYPTAQALQAVDPIAYNQEYLNYIDSLDQYTEIEENYYLTEDLENAYEDYTGEKC